MDSLDETQPGKYVLLESARVDRALFIRRRPCPFQSRLIPFRFASACRRCDMPLQMGTATPAICVRAESSPGRMVPAIQLGKFSGASGFLSR